MATSKACYLLPVGILNPGPLTLDAQHATGRDTFCKLPSC